MLEYMHPRDSRSTRMQHPPKSLLGSPDNSTLRKGKWTIEEENYANKIIYLFNKGMLPIVAGTTLRSYLSEKLSW